MMISRQLPLPRFGKAHLASIPAMLASLLSACGQSGDARAADAAPGPTVIQASTATLRPGLYRVVQTGDVEMVDARCILASDVAAGRFVAGALVPSDWTVESNRMAGGSIALTARHPRGGRMALSGRYQAESFTIDGTLDLSVNGEAHRIKVTANGRFQSPDCAEAEDQDA